MTLISFFVTSAGFVRRLIWPGLLLMSLASNLLFAGLYAYHNWGWKVLESTAAVLLWSAQSKLASVESIDLKVTQQHQKTSSFWQLVTSWGEHRCQLTDFQHHTSMRLEFQDDSMVKIENQVIHDGLKKYFGFCGMALFCLGLSLLLCEHRCMCNWFKRLKCCTDACWHFKYWSVKCAIVMYCSVNSAQTQRVVSYLLTVTV